MCSFGNQTYKPQTKSYILFTNLVQILVHSKLYDKSNNNLKVFSMFLEMELNLIINMNISM